MEKEIEKVLKKIDKCGFVSYVVGGYVRDYLLGRKSVDIDIATNALPKDLINIFPNAKIDSKYGSVKFTTNKFNYDITTFREENYQKEKLEINYVNDLYLDAKRRDFTINAIYMDKNGNIIDPYNGINDIKKCSLRIIGDASTRFKEDPERILRALRFKIDLNFKFDKKIIESINKHKKLLKDLSYYRKKEELNKIFISKNKLTGMNILKFYKLINILEINYDNIKFTTDPLGIWSQIEYSDEYPFTKQEKNIIKKLRGIKNINNHTLYENGLYVSLIASEILNVDKTIVNKIYKKLPIKEKKDIKINYKNLINLGYKVQEINDIIKKIEKDILLGICKNNKRSIIKYLKRK